ncbi:hypothetical protein BS50DRAFT_641236 [Corynespora cassiicola Philippines]|uniref:Arrestin C-terminal-like domain-containing protein n=1 Tax=Corynespora cassiicola Philippines TaxID=1448308 RepID=A0A2T2N248_CORCC|nr:hypothetical protein BS50DRAFT_641236 [Corynespora cassiicola Philippines]
MFRRLINDSWYTDTLNAQCIKNDDVVLSKDLELLPKPGMKTSGAVYTIKPENHVWPFCFIIDHSLEESIHGFHANFIRYEVNAWTESPGIFAIGLNANQQFRIIGIDEHNSLNLMNAHQTESHMWDESLQYHISIPRSPHYWSQPLRVKFEFYPLMDSIRIEKIQCEFHKTAYFWARVDGRELSNRKHTLVTNLEASLNENSILDLTGSANSAVEHKFGMDLLLPRNLRDCRQSANTSRIRIKHELFIEIHLFVPILRPLRHYLHNRLPASNMLSVLLKNISTLVTGHHLMGSTDIALLAE